MKIDVKTAVEGCDKMCPHFNVKTIELFADNNIYHRVYKCSNLEMCESILEVLDDISEERNDQDEDV